MTYRPVASVVKKAHQTQWLRSSLQCWAILFARAVKIDARLLSAAISTEVIFNWSLTLIAL